MSLASCFCCVFVVGVGVDGVGVDGCHEGQALSLGLEFIHANVVS